MIEIINCHTENAYDSEHWPVFDSYKLNAGIEERDNIAEQMHAQMMGWA